MVRKIFSFLLIVLLLFISIALSFNDEPDIDQKIGQMLMVGFRGLSVNQNSPIVSDLQKYHLGGVILFDYDVPADSSVRNISSASQVKKLTASLQKFAQTPLFISVDQEGGKIVRLKEKHGFDRNVSHRYLGQLNDPDSTRYYARKTANLLTRMGINVNLAPVVDLNINPENPVIGRLDRSFSSDPFIVTRQAKIYIQTLHQHGIITSLKHFPGHGSSKEDSHLGVVDVSQTWKETELIPYREIIQKGLADMVMTAHIFNSRLDSVYPATLSGPTINGLLRDSLNFSGVVVSDDLQMKAIRTQYGLKEAIKLSIETGVDILVFANNSIFDEQIVEKAHRIIKELVEKNEISKKRIDDSYKRIINLKKEYITGKN